MQQFLIVCDRPLLRKSFAAVTSRYGFIRPTSVHQHSIWLRANVLKFDGQISIGDAAQGHGAARVPESNFARKPDRRERNF